MSTVATTEKITAPYVGFPTFKNFIKKLSDNGVPTNINKSVMDGMAGGTQSHLTIALRFLSLIDDSGKPSENLHQLVDSFGSDDWSEVLKPIISESYLDIIGDLDTNKASADELDKCFESIGFSSTGLDKVVRFYIASLDECGIEYSSFIKSRKPRATRNRKTNAKTKKNPPGSRDAPTNHEAEVTPNDQNDFPVYFSSGRKGVIRVPSDLNTVDCVMLEAMVTAVKAFAESND